MTTRLELFPISAAPLKMDLFLNQATLVYIYLIIHRLEICSNLFLISSSLNSSYLNSSQHLSTHLEETNSKLDVDVITIHSRIFSPTFEYVSKTISDLFKQEILISTINKHFARYMNCTELMRAEINHIITAIERTSEESYKPSLDETMRKVDCYFSLQKSQNSVQVLKVRDSYGFTGEFSNTEFISNLEKLDCGTAQLKLVTPELLKTTDSLVNFNQTLVNILKTLMKCVNLFTWTAGILKKPSDLDDFTDLALNCVDNTSSSNKSVFLSGMISGIACSIEKYRDFDSRTILK